MLDRQDASEDKIFAPLLICIQILTALWQRASEESNQPYDLFEEWMQEVSSWGRLSEWKADFKQKLRFEDNLWLPSTEPEELAVLLAIADLADALGCNVSQFAKAIMKLGQPSEDSSESLTIVNQVEVIHANEIKTSQEKVDQLPPAINRAVDYQPLVDTLNDWQAMFELALDEAAKRLDSEYFPAEDLSASLSEMCELLRGVLTKEQRILRNL
jgi:hypothetical protein